MRPARPWRLEPTLRLLVTLPLVLMVIVSGVSLLARARYGADPASWPVWLPASGTGLTHLVALGLFGSLLRGHGLTWREAFGLFQPGWTRAWLNAAALTLPALVAAWLAHQGSGWLLDRVGIGHDQQAAVEAVQKAALWWERGLLFVFAVVTAPVAEELLFRGVLWPLARDSGWRVPGALLVSLLFAAIHGHLVTLVPLCLLGLFWIWLYECSQDLTIPILSHALFNAANFIWIVAAPSPAPHA